MLSIQYGTTAPGRPTGEAMSQVCAQEWEEYLTPWSERLDAYVDRRIVGTLIATVVGIVQTRSALTLTELGSTITGPQHAEAGTQRLERLRQHQGWQAKPREQVLWEQAEVFRHEVEQRGETPLCIWDSRVLEKAESQQLEGLGKVRSSKARRLARSRPGVFNRPGAPIRVRGFEWEALLLVGKSGGPQVAAMRWWSRTTGEVGERERLPADLLGQVAWRWGRQVRHVFDRGYGNGPWLAWLSPYRVRFVVRWMQGRKLLDAAGQERKAWEIARGKRAWGEARLLWDTPCHVFRSTRVLALPVRHPEYTGPLWLVVVRQGKGREPWYLLTHAPVETEQEAWDIAISYVRRWQIEES